MAKKQRLWAIKVTPKKGEAYISLVLGLSGTKRGVACDVKELSSFPDEYEFGEEDVFTPIEVEIKEKTK